MRTTPRDKRTLVSLIEQGHLHMRPAQLLLNRVKTLLQREIRRSYVNDLITSASIGPITDELVVDGWYWILDGQATRPNAHIYIGPGDDGTLLFEHLVSGKQRRLDPSIDSFLLHEYIPIAEAILRAQKAFMTIELECLRTFSYDAFAELSSLRVAIKKLLVVSQMTCERLDTVRLDLLHDLKRRRCSGIDLGELVPGETYFYFNTAAGRYDSFVYSRKDDLPELDGQRVFPTIPQSTLVIGGGPAGLVATIHCLESCLSTGGVMKLFEARDAFVKGGATYERAQIVRLDARWIAMVCLDRFPDHSFCESSNTSISDAISFRLRF